MTVAPYMSGLIPAGIPIWLPSGYASPSRVSHLDLVSVEHRPRETGHGGALALGEWGINSQRCTERWERNHGEVTPTYLTRPGSLLGCISHQFAKKMALRPRIHSALSARREYSLTGLPVNACGNSLISIAFDHHETRVHKRERLGGMLKRYDRLAA